MLLVVSASAAMEPVRVSPDHMGFVLASGERFVPWGHNYAADGLTDPVRLPWKKIESDFADMKCLGTNVARIHLEFPAFMDGPDKSNAEALKRLSRLLELAETRGIYLDITGLACYRPEERADWYDAMRDKDRWAVQARFWEIIADRCTKSPAVFCYDLANEPIVFGRRKDGWYTGRFGGFDFLQRLSLDQHDRPPDEIALEWTRRMVAAIRKHDHQHLVTIGMLPAWGVSQKVVGPELDFISVHIYPEKGKIDEALHTLKQFYVGKPVVVEETFPLSCSTAELREFLLHSRGQAAGWIGHYPRESPAELASLRQSKKITISQSIYLDWIEVFRQTGPEMMRASQP
jgi:hypothetical protein